jgi:hypothetical protein
VPYNGMLVGVDRFFGIYVGFPSYMIATFLLPLIYGAWRFVLVHAVAGGRSGRCIDDKPKQDACDLVPLFGNNTFDWA